MSVGPIRKLSYAHEAGFFIHSRRLKIMALHPNPPNASSFGLGLEGVQQRSRIATSPIRLIDPHLFEFGSACPGKSCCNTDDASNRIADHKAKSLSVIAPYRLSVEGVDTVFDGVDFTCRKIVLRLGKGSLLERSIPLGRNKIVSSDKRPGPPTASVARPAR